MSLSKTSIHWILKRVIAGVPSSGYTWHAPGGMYGSSLMILVSTENPVSTSSLDHFTFMKSFVVEPAKQKQ